MRIIIDGDGCPVIEETIEVAFLFDIDVLIFCDYAHHYEAQEGVQVIICDQGKDSVDFQILKRLNSGDVLITQDYGLAQLALTRDAYVVSQNGMRYHHDNIVDLLSQREQNAKMRQMGMRTIHAKKRTHKEDDAFVLALTSLLGEIMNGK